MEYNYVNYQYLVFDTETGGLSEDVSLLTAYFAILDKDLNIIAELDLKLIPDDGIYRVEPEALEVNQINLKELAKEAIPYKEAKTVLYKFLSAYKPSGDGEKLIPIGQNVRYDIDWITKNLLSVGSWNDLVTFRYLDTMLIARFLQLNGRLDVESVSLANLVKYFEIKVDGNPHEARYDALATAEVYKKLSGLVKG